MRGFSRKWLVGAALSVTTTMLATGCGGSGEGTGRKPPPSRPPAAEPANAPPVETPPAGRVIDVGASPEGVAADAKTHEVAVGAREPDRLVLLDGRSGQVQGKVPLPGHLRHLQLAGPGGPVLVPDENSGKLLTVALPGGDVRTEVRTGKSPHDATAAGNGSVFVANEAGHSVAVVRDGTVVHTFTDATQPAGLAAVGNLVGLIDVRQDNLHLYDAGAPRRVATLPAGNGPTHLVADKRGHLAVTDTRGNAILLYALQPKPRRIGKLDLPGKPYGIAYDPARDRLWVTLTARNEVVSIDESTEQPHVERRVPTVRQPNTVAVDSGTGRVFVTGTHDGKLELIDP